MVCHGGPCPAVFFFVGTRASEQKKNTAGQDPPWHTRVNIDFGRLDYCVYTARS